MMSYLPSQVPAHHLPAGWGPTQAHSGPRFSAHVQHQRYDHDNVKADVQSLTISTGRLIWDRLDLNGYLPFHRVKQDGKPDKAGLGDIEINLKTILGHVSGRSQKEETGGTLSIGMGLELPTGNDEDGLGSGHLEISPYVSGFLGFNHYQIYSSVQYLKSFEDEENPAHHPNFVSPHADEDFTLTTGAAYFFSPWLYTNGSLRFEFPQEGDDDGKTFVTFFPELAWQHTYSVWIVLGGQISLSSENWYDHGIGLTFQWKPR